MTVVSNKYTLSVVIPAYNCETTLEQCVDSLLEQKSKDIEIIIVNDGSKDETEIICKRYADKYSNIKYFYKANSGVSDTRNYGIEKASGLYIAFLDSDDVWDKNYYDNELNGKLKKNNVDIFVFSSCFSDMDFNITEYVKVESKVLTDAKDKAVDTYYHTLGAFIFNRKFLVYNNLCFNSGIRYGEDELFRSQCLYLAHKIVAEDKLSYYYRNNVYSATKINRDNKLYATEKLKVYYYLKDFFLEQYLKQNLDTTIKNGLTVTYLAESIRLLSEIGFEYKKLKKICEEENVKKLYDNNGKYYTLYYIQQRILDSYIKSSLIFYVKHRFHGLWFYNAVNLKHSLMRLNSKRKSI